MPDEDRDRTIRFMPMIDVFSPIGTFSDKSRLAQDLAQAVMRWEGAAGDPTPVQRTWVLLTESPEGGWGIAGHANTQGDIAASARTALSAGA